MVHDGERLWVDMEEFDTSLGIVDWEQGEYFEAIGRDYLASGKGQYREGGRGDVLPV